MDRLLQEGDIFEIKEGMKISADVPEHFVYSNKKGCFDLTHSSVTVGGELAYLAGRYVVYKTTYDGGGTGHGPGDVYPDGHHIWAERLPDKGRASHDMDYAGTRIDFYQSGCFTNEVLPAAVEVVGKATMKFVEE